MRYILTSTENPWKHNVYQQQQEPQKFTNSSVETKGKKKKKLISTQTKGLECQKCNQNNKKIGEYYLVPCPQNTD